MLATVASILLGIGLSMPTGDIWEQQVIDDFENIDHTKAFKSWKNRFNKKYSNITEEGHRFIQFVENWEMINNHNKLYQKNKVTYFMGLNQFGDLSEKEFRIYVHGHDGSCVKDKNIDRYHISTAVNEKPKKPIIAVDPMPVIDPLPEIDPITVDTPPKNENKNKINFFKKMNHNNKFDSLFDEFDEKINNMFKSNENGIDFNLGGINGHFEFNIKSYFRRLKSGDVPDSIDWTNMNGSSYVTPVKNQGQCGSCWAFSTTGSIESRSAIKNGWTGSKIPSLSEQQLVDCSQAEGNQGCNGGLMEDGFEYVQKEGGLCTESEYPYTAKDGTCKAKTCGQLYDPITGYKVVTKDSEPSLQAAVAEGPVSVSVDAAGSAWQFYRGGVVSGECGILLDHGVLAVGYGHDSSANEDYWKVKNSWGVTWGEKGYIRICRNCNKNGNMGECGILRDDSYPTV